jgi:protein-tyrosine phosphatase
MDNGVRLMGSDVFRPDELTELSFGLPGRVFRSPMPFKGRNEPDVLFESYRREHISVVVMLVPDRESRFLTGKDLRDYYTGQGLEVIYLPMPDFSVPEINALREAVNQAYEKAKSGYHVVVHCNAGIGRTGLFMACLAKRVLELPGEQAVEWVRQYIPHALESPVQIKMAHEFSIERQEC